MNDDLNQLEQRLTEVGERWREEQPAPYELDSALFAPPRRRRFRLRIEPSYVALTGVAAVFVAILVGVFAIAINQNGGSQSASDADAGNAQRARAPALENGQLVTATGTFDDAIGDLRLCPRVALDASAQSEGPGGERPCPGGVRLVGDLGSNAQFAAAPVTVVGKWRDGTIDVTQLRQAAEPALKAMSAPARCAEVVAGNIDRARSVVRQDPSAYSLAWKASDGTVIVGATGDLKAARAELGNDVCVVPAPYSYTALTKAQRAVHGQRAAARGIFAYGIEVVDNVAVVALHVPVMTDEVRDFAREIGPAAEPIPWITPAR